LGLDLASSSSAKRCSAILGKALRSRGWPVAVITVVLGCSPATRGGSPGAPIAPADLPISEATWRAKARFVSAARAGDAARISELFVEDALLIVSNGDTIRGRNSIALYLAQLAPGAISADFHFGRDGELEICGESARERLAYTAYLLSAGGAPDTVSGKVLVSWKRDSTSEVKVVSLVYSEWQITRGLRPSECRTPEDSLWGAWRFALTIVPLPAVSTTETRGSFEGVLRARGWTDQSCICSNASPIPTPLSDWNGLLIPSLVEIEYRLRRHVVASVFGGFLSRGSTMGARLSGNRDYAQTRLTSHSGVVVGTLISYEHWGFQVGLGPALQSIHWLLQDSFRPGLGPGNTTVTDYKWSRQRFGFVVDAKLQRLLYYRVLISVGVQARRFPKEETPATARFAPARVNQNSSFLGIGFGVVF